MTRCRALFVVGLAMVAACAEDRRVPPVTMAVVPQPATDAILRAFVDHHVVAIADIDQLEKNHEFMAGLIRDSAFTARAGNIVVEWGNVRYQDVLDRYLAGDSVPRRELQQIWRNTAGAVGPGWEAPIYEGFFRTVREANRGRAPDRKVRVWLGDPAIDWSTVQTVCDVMRWIARRDSNMAQVVREQVLAHGRRALLVAGTGHVLRGLSNPDDDMGLNAVALLERNGGERVFVVLPHRGFVNAADSLERRLGNWSAPSIAVLEGTWLGAVEAQLVFPPGRVVSMNIKGEREPDPFEGRVLADLADAHLYLGPSRLLRRSRIPEDVSADTAYMAEIERRNRIVGLDERTRGRPSGCWEEMQKGRP